MQTCRRVLIAVLLLLTTCIAPVTGIAALPPMPIPVPFDTYNSYVVSSKFEPDAARSFLVIQDQKTFDEVFGTATGDHLHQLPANIFDTQIVLTAIRRGKAAWEFNASQVFRVGPTLEVHYKAQEAKSNSAENIGPLIISVPKGNDRYVRFIENGRPVKIIELVPPQGIRRSVCGWIGEHDGPPSPALALLGREGVLLIRSEARWDEWRKRVAPAGPLVYEINIDFAKQSAVVFYKCGPGPDGGCDFGGGDLSAKSPWLQLRRASDFYADHIAPHYVNYVLIPIPATTPAFKVMGGDSPAAPDFSVVLGGQEGGDIVDSLQAVVAPKHPTIKPGEDIEIDMTLHWVANAPAAVGGAAPHAAVWDAVFSEGYRNYGFFVTGPDGKTTLLRPAEIKDWDKNAPHVVDITAANPYHLSDDRRLSLKDLGFVATTPGIYTITGLYEEAAGKARDPVCWAGSIASNPITVRVQD